MAYARPAMLVVMILPTAFAVLGHATAQGTPATPVPDDLGHFRDWIAADYVLNGQKVCYAYTSARTTRSATVRRDEVVLSVTRLAQGHDEVTISSGQAYPPEADVTMRIDRRHFSFRTAGRSASRSFDQELISAFKAGTVAVTTVPHPDGGKPIGNDTFSLAGFTAAYKAIVTACPR